MPRVPAALPPSRAATYAQTRRRETVQFGGIEGLVRVN
jgi:hypothetical protein